MDLMELHFQPFQVFIQPQLVRFYITLTIFQYQNHYPILLFRPLLLSQHHLILPFLNFVNIINTIFTYQRHLVKFLHFPTHLLEFEFIIAHHTQPSISPAVFLVPLNIHFQSLKVSLIILVLWDSICQRQVQACLDLNLYHTFYCILQDTFVQRSSFLVCLRAGFLLGTWLVWCSGGFLVLMVLKFWLGYLFYHLVFLAVNT